MLALSIGGRDLRLLACCTIAALTAPAFAADRPDLNGTWKLDPSHSQDPAEVLSDAAEAESQGAGQTVKRVLRSVSVFGIPVGNLPLPSKDEEETDEKTDEDAYLDRLLVPKEIDILQEGSATEIDYKPGDSAAYRHGVEVETEEANVVAEWRNDVFEVAHELSSGTKITESFVLEPTGSLRWTVQIDKKRAKPVAIMRVFTREPGDALRFAAS